MAGRKRGDGKIPQKREYITRDQAAAHFGVDVGTVSRWKAAGKHRGFYETGIYLPELIASDRELAVEKAQRALGASDAIDAKKVREGALAVQEVVAAQKVLGQTCYVDDITRPFMQLVFDLAQLTRRQSRNMAPKFLEWVAGQLDDVQRADPDLHAAVMAKLDLAGCESMIDDALNGAIEMIGRKGQEIIPNAIAKAKIATA